jgi:hypothetical protein
MKPIIVGIYSWGLSTAKSEIATSFSIQGSKSFPEDEGENE